MKRLHLLSWLLFAVLVMAMALYFFWKNEMQDTLITNQAHSCLYSATVNEVTALHNWTLDSVVHAVDVQNGYEIYDPLKDWKFNDRYAVWENPSTGQTVLNRSIFSDLQYIDVTGFGGDIQPTVIGKIKSTLLPEEEWQKVGVFLVQSHIIRTYAHLESDVCLTEEKNTTSTYTATFTGVHRYCTNDCSEEPFTFTLEINKLTGEIKVS